MGEMHDRTGQPSYFFSKMQFQVEKATQGRHVQEVCPRTGEFGVGVRLEMQCPRSGFVLDSLDDSLIVIAGFPS